MENTLPKEVELAVKRLRKAGWHICHLLNVSEFINPCFEATPAHDFDKNYCTVAEYLAADEENVVTYASYVLSFKK